MTLYSAGLRTGEAIHLRLEDIDRQRAMIRVDQRKGRRDGYVMLSRPLHSYTHRIAISNERIVSEESQTRPEIGLDTGLSS